MDFRLSAAEEALRADVRSWLKANLPAGLGNARRIAQPHGGEREDRGIEGVAGNALPRRLGGHHLAAASTAGAAPSLVEQLIFNEECAAANAPDSINLGGGARVWSARR